MEDRLLTVREVATLKGVSRAAVYAAVGQGRVPHVMVLGRIGLREEDVRLWTPLGVRRGRPPGTPMTAAARARIADAQKRRWQARKRGSSL